MVGWADFDGLCHGIQAWLRALSAELLKTVLLAAGLMLAAGPQAGEPDYAPERLVVAQFDFEAAGLNGWHAGQGFVSIERTAPHGGVACALLTLDKGGSRNTYAVTGLPALTQPRKRLLRVSCFVRTENLKSGDAYIALLKHFKGDAAPQWFDFRNIRFCELPPASTWTAVQGQGFVEPEVVSVGVYVFMAASVDDAQLWIDDVSVELMDRGLMLRSGKRGNIFTEDRALVDLVVSAPDKVIRGAVTLRDEASRVVGRLAIEPGTPRLTVELPARGYYEIEAEAAYRDGLTVVEQVSAAVVGPLIPEEQRLRSPFGLTGNGDLFVAAGARWNRPFHSLNRPHLKAAAEAGFPVKPAPGPESSGAARRQSTSIHCLWPQPQWLQDRDGQAAGGAFDMYSMRDREQFRRLIQYVVGSIPGQVEYVEVANEPDCGWHGPLKGLVEYHRAMAAAVKAVSPDTKVIGPGPCTIKIEFLDGLQQLGLFDHLDGVVVHAYVKSTRPEDEFIGNVRLLKSYLASIGRREMPIFITEYGWPLPPGDWQKPVTALTQARYTSRSLILLAAEEIAAILTFNLWWADPRSGAAAYGLLNWDMTPRPGYAAYANATRYLTGVEGPGRHLRISPTTNIVIFRKGAGAVVAAWDIAGSATAFVPQPWRAARDMTGRPVAAAAKLGVSPSPTFIELPGRQFYDIAVANPDSGSVRVGLSSKRKLPWPAVWAPAPLAIEGTVLHVPAAASAGPYMIIGKTSAGWHGLRIEVGSELEVTAAELGWPVGAAPPRLEVDVRRHGTPVEATCRLSLPALSDDPKTVPVSLLEHARASMFFQLAGMQPGRRYIGEIALSAEPSVPEFRAGRPLDLTWVPCYGLARTGEALDWAALPVMDISSWSRSHAAATPPAGTGQDDGAVTLQTGLSEAGLHFRIRVRDSDHRQDRSAQQMWRQDSVQLAFDMDAEQGWRANAGGYNGHVRIYEYGVALSAQGPLVWRWISYDKNLPASQTEARLQTEITCDQGLTVYELLFPWPTLGLDRAPAGRSKVGFSLLVNDVDGAGERDCTTTLFGGIGDRKDPARFGALWMYGPDP